MWYTWIMNATTWTMFKRPGASYAKGYMETDDFLRYRKDDNGDPIVQKPFIFKVDTDQEFNLEQLTAIFNSAPADLEDVSMAYYDTDTGCVQADFYGWRNTKNKRFIEAACKEMSS